MNPFKGIISHYKITCPVIKGFTPIYKYLYKNIYALTLILRYSYIMKEFFKFHSLTALIGWDWHQGVKEYSSVQSLVQQYKQANQSSLVGSLSETRLSCLLFAVDFLLSASTSCFHWPLSTVHCQCPLSTVCSFLWQWMCVHWHIFDVLELSEKWTNLNKQYFCLIAIKNCQFITRSKQY